PGREPGREGSPHATTTERRGDQNCPMGDGEGPPGDEAAAGPGGNRRAAGHFGPGGGDGPRAVGQGQGERPSTVKRGVWAVVMRVFPDGSALVRVGEGPNEGRDA